MNGQALRIFAHAPRRRSLVRPGRSLIVVSASDEQAGAPVTIEPQPIETAAAIEPALIEQSGPIEKIDKCEPPPQIDRIELLAPLTAAVEQTLLDILASTPAYGETIEAAYRRKEHALAEVFGSLTRSEAAMLHRRLSEPREGDLLAQRFTRLVVDRRTRLLAVLADIPRREARRR